MDRQVEASTVRAGALFSGNRFVVPDFQREYSWEAGEQVADFWRDLSFAIDHGDYFLGLVILTEAGDSREVVDGQQRLITLSLLANVIRLSAIDLERRLVAESIRSDFLHAIDYSTEEQRLRLILTDHDDARDFQRLVEAPTLSSIPSDENSKVFHAHYYLQVAFREDIERASSAALRIGKWAEFVTSQLHFAVFMHPDKAAAFRVYEVINTRGKDLTPSELIKSYLIGTSEDDRSETYERWKAIEAQFEELSAASQLTTFVRHVVTLTCGYVIPRDLYFVVTREYVGREGAGRLLAELESHLPVYAQMIDPSADVESTDARTRAFALLQALSGARFRPIFLEAVKAKDSDSVLAELVSILVPGIIAGGFGTGSVEAQVARSARRVHASGNWREELERLGGLRPGREEFALKLTRNLNKQHLHVVRSALVASEKLPSIEGYVHQIRPRNATDWPEFDFEAYREIGGTLGNAALFSIERRPQGTRSPDAVAERLAPYALDAERGTLDRLPSWSEAWVRQETERLSELATELWYGA